MNVEFVNPFIDATLNVLRTMAQIEAMPGKVSLKNGKRSIGDVTGIIGLAGKEVKGSFAISFSESCIKRVVSNMLGVEIKEVNGDIMDAVGELTNMISGGARAELDERGYSFEMAIPTVVSGEGHTIMHVTDHPVLLIPFDTAAGPFFMEACLRIPA